MKNILLLVACTLCLVACKTQQLSLENNPYIYKLDTLQKLNISKFNTKDSISANGTKIERSQLYYYYLTITLNNSPYTRVIVYDNKTGEYRGGGVRFYSFEIGKWVAYNNEPEKTKEIWDYDQDYPFSYRDLIEKIKKEYKVDLEKDFKIPRGGRDISVSRGIWREISKPVYTVEFRISTKEQKNFVYDKELDNYKYKYYGIMPSVIHRPDPYWHIFIDGNTGETLMAKQAYDRNNIDLYFRVKVLKRTTLEEEDRKWKEQVEELNKKKADTIP